MKKDDCIFCKISEGEIPSRKIYEDKDLIAIMDLSPTSKGHSLIIPKEHYTNIYDIDEEIAGKVMKTAKKLITWDQMHMEMEHCLSGSFPIIL